MAEPTSAPPGGGDGSPLDKILNAPANIRKWWQELTQVFDPAFLILISSVYFLQGMGSFATYTLRFYYMRDYKSTCPCMLDPTTNQLLDDIPDGCADTDGCHMGLGLQPAMQTTVKVFGALPWNYKIYYGILSDCVPIFGSHRRSYICLAGLIGTLAFIGLGLLGDGSSYQDKSELVNIVKWLVLITSLSTAFCDVCTDALVAANAKMESENGAGNLQSLCWFSLAVGGIISNLFAGTLYNAFAPSTRMPFFLCAMVPAGRLYLAYNLKEPGPPGKVDLQKVVRNGKKLVKTLGNPGINRPIAFIFLSWATIPDLVDPQFNFMTSGDNLGWTATYRDGSTANALDFSTSRFGQQFQNATIDCQWFADNDPGCTGAWAPDQQPNFEFGEKSFEELQVANIPHIQTLPHGWGLKRERVACAVSKSGTFVDAIDACADTSDCVAAEIGMGPLKQNCEMAGCAYIARGDPQDCVELAMTHSLPGIGEEQLRTVCPFITAVDTSLRAHEQVRATSLRCSFRVSEVDPSIRTDDPVGELTVKELCPIECADTVAEADRPDVCGVPGGNGESCANTVLAEAWANCPQACNACDSTKRGCAKLSDDFMGQINIVSYAALGIGTVIYGAYFKGTPYRKLLFTAQILLTLFSLVDYLFVSTVNAGDRTVLGIFPPEMFAAFGEASQDVMLQIKLMPMLVLAAQICPGSIEGTLFAFIMGMSNMGNSYAGNFGSWFTASLGITTLDYAGLQTAQALRVVFKLSPIFLLWLVPDENPRDVVARIDAELADVDDDTAADDSSDKPDMNEHGKEAGSSVEWDLSGWPMLVLLMPPVGFVTIAQPIMNTYALSEMFLLLPVLLLICIPAYQIFVKGDTRSGSSGALGEGLTSGDGLADQSDKIDLNEPGAPPPALAGGGNGGEPGGPPPEIPSEGPITAL